MTTKANSPVFSDDLSFVKALVSWVRARCQRIAAEKRISDSEWRDPEIDGVIGPVERTAHKEARRRIPGLKKAEDDLAVEIEERVATNRASGPKLGLDALLEEAGVPDDEFCRTVIILATVAALGVEEANILDPVGGKGFGCNVSAEAVWAFLGLSLAERLRSRLHLVPTSSFMRAGLITLSLGRVSAPRDLPSADIEITSRAFAKMVGMPELAPQKAGRSQEA